MPRNGSPSVSPFEGAGYRPSHALLRFYGELNDFLSPDRRQRDIKVVFPLSPSVKDTIESLGVPHVEVGCILIEGQAVGFGHRLALGERVVVYPAFKTLGETFIAPLRAPLLSEVCFVADVHLGRLARMLRLLGFDVVYDCQAENRELLRCSLAENRVLLTRDRALLKHGDLIYGTWVRNVYAQLQAIEVLRRFDLGQFVAPLTRCPRCNGRLERVAKAEVADRIPPRTAAWLDDYFQCATCRKLYWQGTHVEQIRSQITQILNALQTS